MEPINPSLQLAVKANVSRWMSTPHRQTVAEIAQKLRSM
jgi:hypothetical protein